MITDDKGGSTLVIGVPTITRDESLIPRVSSALDASLNAGLGPGEQALLHVVAMHSERHLCERWQEALPHRPVQCSTVPDYAIQKRHNFDTLVHKRNMIRTAALQHPEVQELLFLDSDTELRPDTIRRLRDNCTEDICIAAYHPRWMAAPVVGVRDGDSYRIQNVYDMNCDAAAQPASAGGMGATLLRGSALDVPFAVGESLGIKGEDIGFFLEAERREIRSEVIPCYHVDHLTPS